MFISIIKQDIFELAKENISVGRSIKNEGRAIISNIDDLRKGRFLCAWATGTVLGEYKNIQIPNPYDIRAKSIGMLGNSIEEYLSESNYKALHN